MKNAKSAVKALYSLFFGAAMVTPLVSAPAAANPTQYEISFSGGSVTPTGNFVYDPDVPAFSNFTVMWDGVTFDLTGAANTPVLNEGSILELPLCGAPDKNAALTFGVLTDSGCSPTPAIIWQVDAFSTSTAAFIFNWPTNAGGGNFFIASPAVAYANECFSTCSRGDFSVTAVVPEPATLALLGIGIAGIGLSRRRGIRVRAA
ncbi:MAG TPA: PEP-CTERM sorting domain-containing protein [Casimicrobiaceae bacterium]|nr:PEP-CTERM sorting domain-containing protein [Casimicrobiaceae bacterium]